MATEQDKDWLHGDKKQEGNQDATGVPRQELNRNTSGNTGMQSEQSGTSASDRHQGSHVSGQNGMHNTHQQNVHNLSAQGMQGERNSEVPGGHVGMDSNETGNTLSGGIHHNEEKLGGAQETDSGQGSAGIQGQYAGQGSDDQPKIQDEASRQREDFSHGDALRENPERQGPDALNKKTDQDDANRQRKDYSDLSRQNGRHLDDEKDINKGI
jgi:hypothetical protein